MHQCLVSNATQHSKPVTISAQISSFIQARHEIIVKATEPTIFERLQVKNSRALQSHADRAIEQSKDKHIEQIRVASDSQLKSGDLSIKTTKLEAWGQCANGYWANRVGRATIVRVPKYCIVALGIQTNRFHPSLLFFLFCLCP
jgi:hypothetical protein